MEAEVRCGMACWRGKLHLVTVLFAVVLSQVYCLDGSLDVASKDKKSLNSDTLAALEKSAEPIAEEKRKWGQNNMRVWGKRGVGDVDSEAEKRAWQNTMRVWGKRSDEIPDKRWSTMRVWGKRFAGDDLEKRKWGNNNMRVWGKRNGLDLDDLPEAEKRKWSRTMKVWGKRGPMDFEMADHDDDQGLEKRRWNNNMRVWGKRTMPMEKADELAAASDAGENQLLGAENSKDKKAWNNNMRVWGKRSISKRSVYLDDDNELDDPLDKRAWSTNSMRVWGKRRREDGPKRSWKTNVMRVWGKRNWEPPYSEDALDAAKRAWTGNSFRTWGKRATGLDPELSQWLADNYL